MRTLLFGLVATSLLFGGAGSVEAASKKKSKEPAIEVADPVRDATVNIYCRVKSGNKTLSSTGSGVFVGDRGIILTNAHVAQYLLLAESGKKISGGCTVRTGSPAKDAYTASLLYLPSAWIEENKEQLSKKVPTGTGIYDFALISITGAKKGTLPTSFPDIPVDVVRVVSEDEGVTVAGYPADKLDFDEVKKKLLGITASSTVTKVQTFETGTVDLITLAPSAAGGSGSSGGPIVSTAGKVIGITVAKSTSKDTPSLRAITLPYIDRTLVAQTGYNLSSLLLNDFGIRTSSTNALTSPELMRIIEKGVFKKR